MENDDVFLDYSIVKEEYRVQDTVEPKENFVYVLTKISLFTYINYKFYHYRKVPRKFHNAIQFVITEIQEENIPNNGLSLRDRRKRIFRKIDKMLNGRQTCYQCSMVFSNTERYERHIATHNRTTSLQCPKCYKFFKQKANLKSHMNVHTDNRPFVCDICKSTFKRKHDLNYHVRNHMEDCIKCQYCKATYRTRRGLRRHMKSRHPGYPIEY